MFLKTRLATLSIATKRRSARERLGAPGSSGSAPALAHLGMLGALESAWERLEARVLGTPGSALERRGAPGSAWERLGAPGSAWERLGAPVDNLVRNCVPRRTSSTMPRGIAFVG